MQVIKSYSVSATELSLSSTQFLKTLSRHFSLHQSARLCGPRLDVSGMSHETRVKKKVFNKVYSWNHLIDFR